MLKKSMLFLFVFVILMVFTVACSSNTEPVSNEPEPTKPDDTETKSLLGFVGYLPSTVFWSQIGNGIQAQAEETGVVVLNFSTEDNTQEQQEKNIQSAIDSDVQGIILGPVNENINAYVDILEEAGIPIITVDAPLSHPWVSTRISTDGQQAATLAGEFMRDNLAKQGLDDCQVLIISGDEESENAQVRANVPASILEESGFTVNINYSPGWSDSVAFAIALAEFTEHGESICAAFATFQYGTIAIVEASESLGLAPLLVGFDWSDTIQSMIQEERLAAAVIQDPYQIGAQSVEMMGKVLNNEEVPSSILVQPILVTLDNVEEQ